MFSGCSATSSSWLRNCNTADAVIIVCYFELKQSFGGYITWDNLATVRLILSWYHRSEAIEPCSRQFFVDLASARTDHVVLQARRWTWSHVSILEVLLQSTFFPRITFVCGLHLRTFMFTWSWSLAFKALSVFVFDSPFRQSFNIALSFQRPPLLNVSRQFSNFVLSRYSFGNTFALVARSIAIAASRGSFSATRISQGVDVREMIIRCQGTISQKFLNIGAMLACNQESDFWKIICRVGANSLAASWRILAGISSGPVVLFGFAL